MLVPGLPRKALHFAAILTTATVLSYGETTVSIYSGSKQEAADQTKVLEAIRAKSLRYTQNLPNFICTQITHREVISQSNFGSSGVAESGDGLGGAMTRSSAQSGTIDVINEQLTFFAQTEHYKVVTVNWKKVSGLDHMQFAGAISAGEFGSRLHDLFDPRSGAVFNWDKMAKFSGRPVSVFQFRVPAQNGIVVNDRDTGQKVAAAYSGTLYADSESSQVLRMTMQLDLPVDFPIKMVTIEVDYKPVSIEGKSYTLPSRSQVRLMARSRLYVNQIEFKDYHKFTVESTIHYDPQQK